MASCCNVLTVLTLQIAEYVLHLAAQGTIWYDGIGCDYNPCNEVEKTYSNDDNKLVKPV